eukprot:gene2484-2523_t
MQAIADWLDKLDADLPDWVSLPIEQARAQQGRGFARWNTSLPDVATVEVLDIPGLTGDPDVHVQKFTPPHAKAGALLYAHGGGWAFGDLKSHERLMRLLALETGLSVYHVDYRLAPEHPFPAGLNDMRAAWRWLAANQSGPLLIGGDSAGANLALSTCLLEGEAGRKAPDGVILFYGAFAADFDTPSYLRFAEGYGLTRARMMKFFDFYAPYSQRSDKAISPILASEADLAKLPPLYLNAAGLDPLLSDTLALVERLNQAEARFTFDLVEGVHHGFMLMDEKLDAAGEAIKAAAAFAKSL